MEILLWLLPATLVTLAAMAWVGWVGRERELGPDRSDAARQRFAEAIERGRPVVGPARPRPRERSTGVAVRRQSGSRSGTPGGAHPGTPAARQPRPSA